MQTNITLLYCSTTSERHRWCVPRIVLLKLAGQTYQLPSCFRLMSDGGDSVVTIVAPGLSRRGSALRRGYTKYFSNATHDTIDTRHGRYVPLESFCAGTVSARTSSCPGLCQNSAGKRIAKASATKIHCCRNCPSKPCRWSTS